MNINHLDYEQLSILNIEVKEIPKKILEIEIINSNIKSFIQSQDYQTIDIFKTSFSKLKEIDILINNLTYLLYENKNIIIKDVLNSKEGLKLQNKIKKYLTN